MTEHGQNGSEQARDVMDNPEWSEEDVRAGRSLAAFAPEMAEAIARTLGRPVRRSFEDTVKARVECDPAFRDALLAEAVERLLSGELDVGKSLLRDVIGATIGFERLAIETGTPSGSLMSMLSPDADPAASDLFGVIDKVQKACGIHLHIAMGV